MALDIIRKISHLREIKKINFLKNFLKLHNSQEKVLSCQKNFFFPFELNEIAIIFN